MKSRGHTSSPTPPCLCVNGWQEMPNRKFGDCWENRWDFFRHPIRRRDRRPLMARRQMHIAQPHRNALMSHRFLACGEIGASHREPACKGVPKIMKCEVGDSGPLHGTRYDLRHPPLPTHRGCRLSSRRYLKAPARRCQRFTHRHTAAHRRVTRGQGGHPPWRHGIAAGCLPTPPFLGTSALT